MTSPHAFRIIRIRPLLSPNGAIERTEAFQCICMQCGDEARYSELCGLRVTVNNVELTCPACKATGWFSHSDLLRGWTEQVRRDRSIALGALDAEKPRGQ